MDGENVSEYLEDDIFTILEALETGCDYTINPVLSSESSFEFQKTGCNSPLPAYNFLESETEASSPNRKRQKLNTGTAMAEEGQPKMSHITVERNRRKQMNEHLSVLRSLMPCFYVKRGDQASIIGGVINYINELQQLVQSLESKKQRKSYSDIVLSPHSPRKPPLSPRVSLPISPRTPQPYKPRQLLHNIQTPSYLTSPSLPLSPCNSSTSSINDTVNELVATSRSAIAEVEVKFCGPNLLLKTVSHLIPGQLLKIVAALEQLPLQILQLNINKVDERMLNSFTIKIGIECQLSAEELAQQIQQTFC